MSTLAYAYESGYQDGLKASGTEKQEYERRIDELCQENEQLRQWNAKLRKLVRDMWQLINDLDATPYVTERHGNNPAVTWLDDDWSVHESCRERMRELGIEVDNGTE